MSMEEEKRCSQCNGIIANQFVTDDKGKIYHEECFFCDFCKENLCGKENYQRDGKRYCKLDYAILHGNRCYECEKIILGKANIVKDKYYHQECFKCFDCGEIIDKDKVLIGAISYHGEQCEKIFCEADHKKRFAKTCCECGQDTISYIVIGTKILHLECLKCSDCVKSKMGLRNDDILCEKCASKEV